MMTACKKEEMKSTNINLASNLKLIKENVFENSYLGDLYQNPNDGKMLFIIKQTKCKARPCLLCWSYQKKLAVWTLALFNFYRNQHAQNGGF